VSRILGPLLLAAALAPANDLQALFEHGQTLDTFLAAVSAQRELWTANARRMDVPGALVRRLARVNQGLQFLVVGEDWCVDSANTVPYVAALAKQSQVPLRIVSRPCPG